MALQRDNGRNSNFAESDAWPADFRGRPLPEARKSLQESRSSLLQQQEQQPASLLQTASSARGPMLRRGEGISLLRRHI